MFRLSLKIKKCFGPNDASREMTRRSVIGCHRRCVCVCDAEWAEGRGLTGGAKDAWPLIVVMCLHRDVSGRGVAR